MEIHLGLGCADCIREEHTNDLRQLVTGHVGLESLQGDLFWEFLFKFMLAYSPVPLAARVDGVASLLPAVLCLSWEASARVPD